MIKTAIPPEPYRGLSLLSGNQEINVVDLSDNTVFFTCLRVDAQRNIIDVVGTYSKPITDFIKATAEAIDQGAVPLSNLINHTMERFDATAGWQWH